MEDYFSDAHTGPHGQLATDITVFHSLNALNSFNNIRTRRQKLLCIHIRTTNFPNWELFFICSIALGAFSKLYTVSTIGLILC